MNETKAAMEKIRKKMQPKAGSPYLNKPLRTLEQAQKEKGKQ